MSSPRESIRPDSPAAPRALLGIGSDEESGEVQDGRLSGEGFAILAGRFQPYHNGHHALVEACLRTIPRKLLVGVISSELPIGLGETEGTFMDAATVHHAESRNPFSVWERLELVSTVWRTEIAAGRMRVLPLPRPQGPQRWWEFVLSFLPSDRQWVVPVTDDPFDEEKARFFESMGERVLRVEAPLIVRGEEIRDRLRAGQPVEDLVPEAVVRWLGVTT